MLVPEQFSRFLAFIGRKPSQTLFHCFSGALFQEAYERTQQNLLFLVDLVEKGQFEVTFLLATILLEIDEKSHMVQFPGSLGFLGALGVVQVQFALGNLLPSREFR